MADNKKRTFVNKEQKRALVEHMENNPILKNPPKLNNKITNKTISNMWEQLAIHLNKIGEMTGGAVKDAKTWKKTWQDLKSNVKKKASETRRYETGTGGGPALPKRSEDDYELRVLDILNPIEIEGDQNISESDVMFEIVADEDTDNNKNEEFSDFQKDMPGPSREPEPPIEKPFVKESKTISKAKRLTETLQVSNKISKEIQAKTALKQEYYKEKIKVLKENSKIKKQKLEVYKEDIEVKKEIAASLKLIAQNLSPFDHQE